MGAGGSSRAHGGIEDGARVVLGVGVGPIRLRWVSEHRDYDAGKQFRDVQLSGPFARWEHTHRVEPDGPNAAYLEDDISYALPLGGLGRAFGGAMVKHKLNALFDYRHRTTTQDIVTHLAYQGNSAQHILVTGASGLVGSALVPFLTTGGHRVTRLVRSASPQGADELAWNPASGQLDAGAT